MKEKTVTSIVHHHIKVDKLEHYNSWLKKVREASGKFEGYLDAKLIDSLGNEFERISVFRFANQNLLNRWLDSDIHKELLLELNEIVEKEVQIKSYSGIEYWFDENSEDRLKMSLITFIGLLPLVFIVPPILVNLFALKEPILSTLSTAIIVIMMTYLVMPLLMKLVNRLHKI